MDGKNPASQTNLTHYVNHNLFKRLSLIKLMVDANETPGEEEDESAGGEAEVEEKAEELEEQQ